MAMVESNAVLAVPKPQRVLACVLCQQRKVKCDRKFPCQNCVRSRVECVQATLTPRRKRRKVVERALLERMQKYETLLRDNNVTFEPLATDTLVPKDLDEHAHGHESDDERGEKSPHVPSVVSSDDAIDKIDIRNVWHVMARGFRDIDNESDSSDDDIRQNAVKSAWSETKTDDSHLLFGSHKLDAIDLTSFHPDPVQIFKLWQIYLDNINPLLKVTHTPSLQGQIIQAAGDLSNVEPNLEAIMFGIYCVAAFSIDQETCQEKFNCARDTLLIRCQTGAQQALRKADFLRSNSIECLTGLYLYLVSSQHRARYAAKFVQISIESSTVPNTLNSLYGIAVRAAHRIGIQQEGTLGKMPVLEAEMCRRLWYGLLLIDNRTSELANSTYTLLNPTWDCKVPLNVNDSALRPDMTTMPTADNTSSEAFFCTVRGELYDYIRNSMIHIELNNPLLKPLAKHGPSTPTPEGSELLRLERMMEEKYFRHADQTDPLTFYTIWSTRSHIARYRLVEHHCRYASFSSYRTEKQRDAATFHALRELDSDTKVMVSPLTKKFRWLNQMFFPFPAYMQLVQDLRRRPYNDSARHLWEVISDNFDAWFNVVYNRVEYSPIFRLLSKVILSAWEGCQTNANSSTTDHTQPRVVTSVINSLAKLDLEASQANSMPSSTPNMGIDDIGMLMGMDFGDQPFQPFDMDMGMQGAFGVTGQEMFGMPMPAPLDQTATMTHLNWLEMVRQRAYPPW